METSDSSLSSEWDVINFNADNAEDVSKESPSDEVSNDWENKLKDSLSKGSCVEIVDEIDTGHLDDVTKEKTGDHLDNVSSENDIDRYDNILSEENVNNDSNSSSDVDVIEESPEDLHHSRMLMPPMEYLSSALAASGPLVPASAPATNTEDRWNNFLLTHRLLRNPHFRDYIIIIVISIAVAFTMHMQGTPEDKIKLMKEQVDELKKENTHLKNMVNSKVEDDKFIQNVEVQITDLKVENLKLTSSLQSLIARLQEQTALFEKSNNMRKKDPYKPEIDKLKEQVNLLQIDNDDLQQQLVRIRYGAYSPYPDSTRENSPGKKEVNLDQNDNETSEVLSEEIEKLKKQLYSEVDELKNWKESIDNIIKQMDEKEKKDHDNAKTTQEEKRKKHTNSENQKESDKGKNFYDWSWKEWKKNFGDTFDNIQFPEFSKYVNMDEKKVKHVFDSVGHYFKKAQEKTRKMFNNYKEKGKDDVWEFLTSLRKKWAEMKEEFFANQQKRGPVPPNSDKKFASDFKKPTHYDNEKKKSADMLYKEKEDDSIIEFLMNHPNMKQLIGDDPEYRAKFKKFLEEEEKLTENFNKPEKSWVFGRAAVRDILREKDVKEDEEATNWFLRKKKTAGEDGSDRHDNKE